MQDLLEIPTSQRQQILTAYLYVLLSASYGGYGGMWMVQVQQWKMLRVRKEFGLCLDTFLHTAHRVNTN